MSNPELESIIIANFFFCRAHGSEICNKCTVDHRLCNNLNIQHQLTKEFPDLSEEELLVR